MLSLSNNGHYQNTDRKAAAYAGSFQWLFLLYDFSTGLLPVAVSTNGGRIRGTWGCTICHVFFFFPIRWPITIAQMVFLNSYNGLYPLSCIILMRITDWFYKRLTRNYKKVNNFFYITIFFSPMLLNHLK